MVEGSAKVVPSAPRKKGSPDNLGGQQAASAWSAMRRAWSTLLG